MRVEVISKVIPTSFLKIEGDVHWGERPEKEGWFVELVGDQNQGPEAFPRSKRGGSKGDVRVKACQKSNKEK